MNLDCSAACCCSGKLMPHSQHVSPALVDECLQECKNASPPADLRLMVRLLLLLLLMPPQLPLPPFDDDRLIPS